MQSWTGDVENHATAPRSAMTHAIGFAVAGTLSTMGGLLVALMAHLSFWSSIIYALSAGVVVAYSCLVVGMLRIEKHRDRFHSVDQLAKRRIARAKRARDGAADQDVS